MKICTKCRIKREDGEFPIGRNACVICHNKSKSNYQRSDRGKLLHAKAVSKYKQSKKGKIVKQREYVKGRNEGWDTHYIKYNGRARTLKSRYGITAEDYNRMVAEQKGVCAICGNAETQKRVSLSGKVRLLGLFVDHDHKTGKVRALLCNKCNQAVAYFGENIEYLANAISYLQKHKAPEEGSLAEIATV